MLQCFAGVLITSSGVAASTPPPSYSEGMDACAVLADSIDRPRRTWVPRARHFAGTVAVAARIGAADTMAHGHLLRDVPDSADGRLSEEAIEFALLIRSGELSQADAAG